MLVFYYGNMFRVLLDNLQPSIQRYEVQSVHITYYWTLYYLQGVHKNSLKL